MVIKYNKELSYGCMDGHTYIDPYIIFMYGLISLLYVLY